MHPDEIDFEKKRMSVSVAKPSPNKQTSSSNLNPLGVLGGMAQKVTSILSIQSLSKKTSTASQIKLSSSHISDCEAENPRDSNFVYSDLGPEGSLENSQEKNKGGANLNLEVGQNHDQDENGSRRLSVQINDYGKQNKQRRQSIMFQDSIDVMLTDQKECVTNSNFMQKRKSMVCFEMD